MTKKRFLLALALMLTAVGGAWAQGQLLTTINASSGFTNGTQTFDNIVTVTLDDVSYNANDGWYSSGSPHPVEVAPVNGVTVTGYMLYFSATDPIEFEGSSFTVALEGDRVLADDISTQLGSVGITKIEVYGTAAPEPELLVKDNDTLWHLTVPAGNVTLTVDYYGQYTLDSVPLDWQVKVNDTLATLRTYEGGNPQLRYVANINETDSVELIPPAELRETIKSVRLVKPAATVATTPAANTSVETIEAGSNTPLINAGTAAGGTMMYLVTTTNTRPTTYAGFSATVPTAENLEGGTYYVWYYVKGDADHGDGEISSTAIEVTVEQSVVPVTAITLNKNATTIYKVNDNSTETLSVTAVTPDEATDKTYTWSSDDITKATVDQNGVVTAVAAGTAHIRATANDGSGVYGECTVTVTDLSAYYSKMVECGCGDLSGKCVNSGNDTFTGQVLSAAQAIALAQAKAAATGSNCAVFYGGSMGEVTFAKNDGTTGSAQFYYIAAHKGLTGYRGYYVSQ